MIKVQRALVSVFDKSNIVEFAQGLRALGIEIFSTGGTAKLLASSGIEVIEVSDYTGFPEMMDGRIKTLHPKIHAGILAERSKKEHLDAAKKNNIELIDLVVVNFYPFEQVIGQKDARLEEIVENIDIGGPALLRSAAKNFQSVAVVCNPKQYSKVLAELRSSNNMISEKTRKELAVKAFEYVTHYDALIAAQFRKMFCDRSQFPAYLNISFRKLLDLRYGENPHQKAALYIDDEFRGSSIVSAEIVKEGKALSYNNILDGNAALELVKEFDEPTAVVVKHNNPSGVASSNDILEAYRAARAVDPEAAFGGIVAVNRKVEEALAREIVTTFVEVVIAPGYSEEAKKIFQKRKNLRVLEIPDFDKKREPHREYRSVVGGLLAQDSDSVLTIGELKVVTDRAPSEEEMRAMNYAWKIVKHVKSNSIVFAKENRAIGIGAGQMKRVDAAKLAAMIAKDYSGPNSLKGCAMASDAFLPFRDGIDFAAKLGITAVIQPGGSIKDAEVIKAANEHNITMVFTGTRHFRH